MSISYELFLKHENFDGYENPKEYETVYVPKIQEYRKKLDQETKAEYKIKLPGTIEELAAKGFDPLKYLYNEKLLTEKEFAITDSSASDLLSQMSLGKFSATEVFEAFAKRAVIAQQFTNFAMEFFIDEGFKRAKFLDNYLKEHGKPIGPLHGLPISLKEQMNFRGKITHGSYVSKITNVPEKHGVTNQVLEDLGAIFYVRTSQPQTLMHLDSNNNFIGLSRNPHNLGLSPGGSSSGEGSVVGFGGSAIGVGSDIGGSVRAPAAYSGCHGLRPTTRRLSVFGGVSSGAGQESVPAVCGPLTRSIDDIDLFMKTYINEGKPWLRDAWALPMPWRSITKPKPENITIAVMYDDGIVKPSPPIQRGLKDTVAKLEAAGVKVVEFKPIRTVEAYDTVNKMYNCDGNYMQRKLLSESGEPLKKLTKWSLNFGEGSKAFTVAENRQLNMTRDSLRQEYTEYLVNNDIDFILSPTYNNVAPKPESVYNWSYTALFNILDFPTLVFQTGLYQDPKVDVWDDAHRNYKYRSDLERLECEQYDPKVFSGAPIGLQLSGRRYFDEEVVAAGKSIVDILGTNLLGAVNK